MTVNQAHRETGFGITCMETCQGQEWGIASSPLTTLGVAVLGVTAGFPQFTGQSGKRKLYFVTIYSACIYTGSFNGRLS